MATPVAGSSVYTCERSTRSPLQGLPILAASLPCWLVAPSGGPSGGPAYPLPLPSNPSRGPRAPHKARTPPSRTRLSAKQNQPNGSQSKLAWEGGAFGLSWACVGDVAGL